MADSKPHILKNFTQLIVEWEQLQVSENTIFATSDVKSPSIPINGYY